MKLRDPNEPLVAEDGLEYEDFAAYLEGRPIDCARNWFVKSQDKDAHFSTYIRSLYKYRNRDGHHYAANTHVRFIQGLEHFGISPCGTGGPGTGATPPNPVYAADQPAVRRWMGA